jgi:hypothetical protein
VDFYTSSPPFEYQTYKKVEITPRKFGNCLFAIGATLVELKNLTLSAEASLQYNLDWFCPVISPCFFQIRNYLAVAKLHIDENSHEEGGELDFVLNLAKRYSYIFKVL